MLHRAAPLGGNAAGANTQALLLCACYFLFIFLPFFVTPISAPHISFVPHVRYAHTPCQFVP